MSNEAEYISKAYWLFGYILFLSVYSTYLLILKIEFCVFYLLICVSLHIIEWILAQYMYKYFFPR